jgi:hypothetical protein
MAAQQLDAAAHACDQAAYYLSMAPPKALGWAQGLVGVAPDLGRLPGPRSADRSPLAGDRPPSNEGGGASTGPDGDTPDDPAPFIEEIFKRLPERIAGQGPTRGILTPPDGRGLVHLISGKGGPGAGAPGLTGPTADLLVARDHVEGHVAALLRRPGAVKEATLYINNRPCPGRLGCDRTLEDQLPKGTKLTIYWHGGHKVYRGNGKGMQ